MVIAALSHSLSSHRTVLFAALAVALVLLGVCDYLRRRSLRADEAAAVKLVETPIPGAKENPAVAAVTTKRKRTPRVAGIVGLPAGLRAGSEQARRERARKKIVAASAARRESERAAHRALRRNASRKPDER